MIPLPNRATARERVAEAADAVERARQKLRMASKSPNAGETTLFKLRTALKGAQLALTEAEKNHVAAEQDRAATRRSTR